ncbi:MAG: hypothetical protein OEW05_06550 [Candidatus Aminicenantes bacterium]|nr:hypothetical protein [Candidatus Aminicenantes bacterium]
MKRLFIYAFLFVMVSALAAASPFLITITAPANGSSWNYGATCTVQWTYSPDYTGTTQKCQVYCGSDIISPDILVTQGQFVWTVGRKADGTYIPAGTYEITIESLDYDALNGPNITINPLKLNLDRYNKFPIKKIPDCPMCYGFDLKQLQLEVKFPFTLELFRGQRSLGILGKFAPGRLPTGVAKIVLDRSDLLLIQRGEAAFEIRAGCPPDDQKVFQTKAVALEIQK